MTDQRMEIDPEELTLGDMEALEEKFGVDWLDQFKSPTTELLIWVTWRLLLQQNPEASLDDARKVKIIQFKGGDVPVAVPPTPAETPAAHVGSVDESGISVDG